MFAHRSGPLILCVCPGVDQRSVRRFEFAASIQRGVFRNRLIPDEMAEPIEVCLEQRQGGFRLVNAMPKPGVKNQACIDMLVNEASVKLKGIRNRYSMVGTAMLNQGGRLRLTDRRDR